MAEPPTKGQPPNNGQNARPQLVHYSEVPLYIVFPLGQHYSGTSEQGHFRANSFVPCREDAPT